jgi:hypothetical protein
VLIDISICVGLRREEKKGLHNIALIVGLFEAGSRAHGYSLEFVYKTKDRGEDP